MRSMSRELQEANVGRGKPLKAFERRSDVIKVVPLENPSGNVVEGEAGQGKSLAVGTRARRLLLAFRPDVSRD